MDVGQIIILPLKQGNCDIEPGNPGNGSLQVEKRFFHQTGHHLSPGTKTSMCLVDNYRSARLLHRLVYRLIVQGRNGQEVDYLCFHPVAFLEFCRGLEGGPHHGTIGNYGQILAPLNHFGFAQGEGFFFVRYLFPEGAVNRFGFVEYYRVWVTNGAHQQGSCISRRGWDDHLEAGCVSIVCFFAL